MGISVIERKLNKIRGRGGKEWRQVRSEGLCFYSLIIMLTYERGNLFKKNILLSQFYPCVYKCPQHFCEHVGPLQ